MIISTGMRTDIPAFYSKWFMNRIREGYVCVRNPYRPESVTKYSLSPSVVDCIAFCTKNPSPMLPFLDELNDYGQFWFVTITPYGNDVEPNVPLACDVIDSFKKLSDKLGKSCIGWRYDPILFGMGFDLNRHISEFENMASKLSGYTDVCVISFLDMYPKVLRNAPAIYPPSAEEQMLIGKAFSEIAKANKITLKTCCENVRLKEVGIDVRGCQTKEVIERAIGKKLITLNKTNQRKVCDCLLGNDIGSYNSCGHFCTYCYANADRDTVMKNIKLHNPNSPFLIGNYSEGDVITEAKQKSFIDEQLSLF